MQPDTTILKIQIFQHVMCPLNLHSIIFFQLKSVIFGIITNFGNIHIMTTLW